MAAYPQGVGKIITVVPENTQNEAQIREEIDKRLELAGWVIQDKKRLNLYESLVSHWENITVTGAKRRKYLMKPEGVLQYIQAYKDRCLKECFPERKWQADKMEWVPKTFVFAKDDDHCDRIYKLERDKFAGQQIWTAEGYPKGQAAWTQPDQVFDEGNAFCKKITYKVGKKNAEESIKAFRTDPQYRIAVTVDMITTGTDIRPLECVMFMRDVTRTQFRKSLTKPEGVLKGKSQSYYEQMKGRGTRIISRDELHTNSSGTNLVALQSAPKWRAPGMARDKVAAGKQKVMMSREGSFRMKN